MNVWVLLCAIWVVVFNSAIADHIFSCEDVSSKSCGCSGHSLTHFELLCPPVDHDIQVQINLKESVQLQCFKSENMGFSAISDLHLGDFERFVLRLCPLPNTSIRDLMAKIGISKIKMLQIQSYSLLNDTLHKKHFEKLFDVTNLSLNNNGLTYLPGDLFEDMKNLTWLDMKYNFIDLPREIFSFTPKLEVLELGMNNLTNLIPGIFKNLDRLRLLNLWSNKLTNLTRAAFSDVPNLESLDLNTNQMESIRPDLFADLIKLKRLNLYGNKFVSLPQGLLSGNIYLEEFQMHENIRPIASLPPGFLSNLKRLKVVRLGSSKIMALPEDTFSNSSSIVTLHLNGNFLKSLSKDTFADLEALEYLNLSENNIIYLPDKLFYSTRHLKTLRLDYNNITEIPRQLFSQLKNLEYLDLRFNKIKSITDDQFYGLESLMTLNISDNQIANLALTIQLKDFGSYSVFMKNNKLEDLQLANNSLTEIYFDWKFLLGKLRILNLSFNQFQELKTDDFEFSGDIFVDLSNNNITWVNFWNADRVAAAKMDSFNSSYDRDYRTRSKTIKLDNNPFCCDCQILPFVQFIKNDLSPEVQYLYNIPGTHLKCQEPKNLEKMSLSYLPYKLLVCEFKNSSEYMCPEGCVCQYRPIDKANLINCQNIGLRQIPSSLSTYKNANHTELYLEGNQLQNVNLPQNKGYKNVTHFNFANNNITNINISSFSSSLKVMDVSNNYLSSIPEGIQFLDKAADLKSLTVVGNPWQCDCTAKDFIDSLKKRHKQIDLARVNCSDGQSMDKLDVNKLCQEPPKLLLLAEVCALMGLLIAMLTILYYRYQTEIHIYCFSSKWKFLRWLVSRPDVDENKKYDAFISYAHEDEDFVSQQLVPYLEEIGETKFKLCLHYRDWTPGEAIPLQILNSVQNSRRTIVVISPSFLGSVWGKMEFKTAHQQALEDGQTRVIAILYKDVGPINDLDEDLKAYFQMNTYVKWDSPWFWQQLNYALPHPLENSEDISCICRCFQRKNQNKTQNMLHSVQIKDRELHYVAEKSEKSTDIEKGKVITPSPVTKPSPLIEEVDLKPVTLSSDSHQNGKVAVCA